jgi:hypothetical protein
MRGSSTSSTDGQGDSADESSEQISWSVFPRGELPIAHGVYGLILALATIAELIAHDVSAKVSVAWLLGASAVLLVAHLFSDSLAHVAATREDPNWTEIMSIGHEDVAVVYGGVGAALIMAVAAIGDLDSHNALMVAVAVGLVALGTLCFFGLSHHRVLYRLGMSAVGVGLGTAMVLLENTI